MNVEWFFNGKPLEQGKVIPETLDQLSGHVCYNFGSIVGARCKTTFDFGFVTLDIEGVHDRDQGLYTCRGFNKYGEAFTASTVYVTGKTKSLTLKGSARIPE